MPINKLFDKSIKNVPCIIILEDEKNDLIKNIHIGLGHIGINRLYYEIIGRGYFWVKWLMI